LGMKFELPFPPSVNHYWRHRVIGRHASVYISADGMDFRREVVKAMQGLGYKLVSRLNVKIYLFPPDRRNRDLDNYAKGTLDALTHAGVWLDDGQIDELTIIRKERIKGGKMIVEISEILE
jgi:crossover junction endodeoxyribonuclease RusA